MATNYDLDIQIGELEVRLQGQEMAKRANEISIMRFRKEIDRLSETNNTLDVEIKKTKSDIEKLTTKGGE